MRCRPSRIAWAASPDRRIRILRISSPAAISSSTWTPATTRPRAVKQPSSMASGTQRQVEAAGAGDAQNTPGRSCFNTGFGDNGRSSTAIDLWVSESRTAWIRPSPTFSILPRRRRHLPPPSPLGHTFPPLDHTYEVGRL